MLILVICRYPYRVDSGFLSRLLMLWSLSGRWAVDQTASQRWEGNSVQNISDSPHMQPVGTLASSFFSTAAETHCTYHPAGYTPHTPWYLSKHSDREPHIWSFCYFYLRRSLIPMSLNIQDKAFNDKSLTCLLADNTRSVLSFSGRVWGLCLPSMLLSRCASLTPICILFRCSVSLRRNYTWDI